MKRLMPRALWKRFLLLLVLSSILTATISFALEHLWGQRIKPEALLDWRFWLVWSVLLLPIFIAAFLISRRWSRSLLTIPSQTSLNCPDSGTSVAAPFEEVEVILNTIQAQRKRNEEEIMELRSFVANASHELRTPLTTLKLRVEALRDGALDDRLMAEKFLQEMESEINHLSQLVSDMLDLSRIEATKDGIPFTEIDLNRIISEVCAAFSVRAGKSNIRLQIETDKDSVQVYGIEDQIRRMVYNLVDNAIKYTPSGGWVKVRLYCQPASRQPILEVEDNGFGIPSHYLPHIFERFYRAEATRPRYGTTRGSGLGLAIVKAIVDTHGGKITAHSQVGKGSLFRIEFPTCS
ncbi:MAG: hypothetical protein Kow0088_19570 [Anaerolineales bacterium]